MADNPEVKTDSADTAGDLRNKLVKRLAMAGVLVAVLLGVLAFFDYLSTPPEELDEEEYTQPVPVPPKKAVSQPVTPTTDLPEPPPPPAPVVAEAPAAPVTVAPPTPAVDTKTEAKTRTEAKVEPRPEIRPPAPSNAVIAKPPAVLPQPAPVARAVRPVPEATSAPSVSVVEEAPAAPSAKPSARVVEARPVTVVAPSGVSRLFSGFLLQAGVFASPQRAEELHAKLTLSGVPSTLETRVQVGPFRTRQEAEAAQVRLRELGVETVLVPPAKGKH